MATISVHAAPLWQDTELHAETDTQDEDINLQSYICKTYHINNCMSSFNFPTWPVNDK